MARFKAIETVKDGKTSVAYYRGKQLYYRIVEYDDGWFHALTDLKNMAGNYVPTLETAKQRIREHIDMVDSFIGKKSTIKFVTSL